MISSSSAASGILRLSANNSPNEMRGPFRNLTGVSKTTEEFQEKKSSEMFISHNTSVLTLVNQAVLLAESLSNTSKTNLANKSQCLVQDNTCRGSIDNHADSAQGSREAGSASLNEKIALALASLPSGTKFSTDKAETAKKELLNDFKSSFKEKTLDKFAAIIEKTDGRSDSSPKAMQCVRDFIVIRHEIKSRLSPEDSKALKELDSVTKSFISIIASNGVGINSFAAGSSKNLSGLRNFEGICSKLISLDKHSQGSSGLSHNVEISNIILNSLADYGLTYDEYIHVNSIFRPSIIQQNDILNGINKSPNLSSFEQAQTRLGQESITFDLLKNALADIVQPKVDDAVNAGHVPEIKVGPSSQPGINITINAPFNYTYHEGNQGSEPPGVSFEEQPTSGATQTDDIINSQLATEVMGELPEEIDSSTHLLQNSQHHPLAEVIGRPVSRTRDFSEHHTQTTPTDESRRQPISRGLETVDSTHEQPHDMVDSARDPVSPPTRNEKQNKDFTERTDRASGTSDNFAPPTSLAPSFIGGPGSSGARVNPAESRRRVQSATNTDPAGTQRPVQGDTGALDNQGTPFQAQDSGQARGANALNSQVTQWQGLNYDQTGNTAGTPAPAGTSGSSRGTGTNTDPAGTPRPVQGGAGAPDTRSTPSQGPDSGQTRGVAGNTGPSVSPASSFIGGPGSSGARANPTEARRREQSGENTLNSQGTRWQGLNSVQTRGVAGNAGPSVSPAPSFIGGPGSSGARANPAESRRREQSGENTLNSQGTRWQGLNSVQTGNTAGTQAPAGTPRPVQGGTGAPDTRSTPSQAQDSGQTRGVAGNAGPFVSPASSFIGGPGSSGARANPAESRRREQSGENMLNSQGTQWQGLDGKQASGITSEQRYKESSFTGSRGSSRATSYFSGVSKSTVKK